jgi:type IV secretion system protein VirD4
MTTKLPTHIALGLGLALALATASTVVAWKYNWAPQLGRPIVGWLYDPWSVVRWGQAWGLEEPYRRKFLAGLSISTVVMMLPFLLLRIYELYSPMAIGQRDRNAGTGDPVTLMRKAKAVTKGDGIVLGRLGRWSQRVLRDNGDGHALSMGPSGGGKGTSHIMPTLLSHSGSMVVYDPKNENAAVTGWRRSQFGNVHIFNPFDAGTSRFNPLDEIRSGPQLIGDCKAAAYMLTHDGRPTKESHWEDAAGTILAAVLSFVVRSDEPTLSHMWRVVQGIVAGRYPNEVHDRFVINTLLGHTARSERERDSINSTLSEKLNFMDDPMVQAATACSDFRSSDLMAGEDVLTLFMSIPPDRSESCRQLTRLILASLLRPLINDVNFCTDGRRKRRKLLAALDEFPQLGKMDVIESGLNIARGYGIRMWLICQDAAQIQSIYGTNQSLTNNCQTITAIAGFSGSSLAMMSSWAGDHAVEHQSRQKPGLFGSKVQESASEARIKVLNPSAMLVRGKDEVLVFMRGCLPTWLYRAEYFRMREYRGLFAAHDGAAAARIPNRESDPRAVWLPAGGRP